MQPTRITQLLHRMPSQPTYRWRPARSDERKNPPEPYTSAAKAPVPPASLPAPFDYESSPQPKTTDDPPSKIKSMILNLDSHKETRRKPYCSAKCPACNRVCKARNIVSRAIIPTICSPSKTGI